MEFRDDFCTPLVNNYDSSVIAQLGLGRFYIGRHVNKKLCFHRDSLTCNYSISKSISLCHNEKPCCARIYHYQYDG